MVYLQLLLALTGLAFGVRLPFASERPWTTLATNDFTPNTYQKSPYVANGYFGQRLPVEGAGYWIYHDDGRNEPLKNSWPLDQPRATFGTVSGFWNLQKNISHVINPINVARGDESVISGIPAWTALVVTDKKSNRSYLPGVDPLSVKAYEQSLSIEDGIVHTNISWNPQGHSDDDGGIYRLNYTVLAHRERLNLGLVRLDLSVRKDVEFKLTDILDGAGAVRADFYRKRLEDNASMWTSVKPWGIPKSAAYIVSTVRLDGSDENFVKNAEYSRHDGARYDWVSKNMSTIAQTWDVSLKAGQSLTVYKYVGIASSDDFPDAHSTAVQACKGASSMPWNQLVSEHSQRWVKTWADGDIIIRGDNVDLQRRIRASLFHILTNLLPSDGDKSITVGGLSSDSYAGLVFWDAETWIYPSILALFPDYARGINNYRSNRLDQALQNAQLYNYSGALFPWTSGRYGNCTGTGVCKGYQYHLNSDIALAHWQYFLQSNDLEWLREKAWPVMKNVADMFAAYVVQNSSTGEYVTIRLGEPDEFAYNINNGAFTNVAVKKLLGDWAPSAAKLLGLPVPVNWSDIAENMYIPYSEQEDIILGFDGMDGAWQVKQASVALINYPLEFQLSDAQARNDVAYYSSINTLDGPAMTWSIYAISSAQLQSKGCATYTYIQRSSEPYIRQPFYQFSETMVDAVAEDELHNPAFIFGLNPAFPFLTGAGGFLQVFTHGLTGFRSKLDAMHMDPVLPPQLGGGILIRGMKWQGAVFDVDIGPEKTSIQLTMKSDAVESVIVRVGREAKEFKLSVGSSVIIPTRRPDKPSPLGGEGENDLALCKPVTSDTDYIPGNYPSAVVDGSNSTVWQPLAARKSSAVIDLGGLHKLSGVRINWAENPPTSIYITGKKTLEQDDWEELSAGAYSVTPSAPYDAKTARIVKIREGNTTEIKFPRIHEVQFFNLSIEGSYAADGRGATVAGIRVVPRQREGFRRFWNKLKQNLQYTQYTMDEL